MKSATDLGDVSVSGIWTTVAASPSRKHWNRPSSRTRSIGESSRPPDMRTPGVYAGSSASERSSTWLVCGRHASRSMAANRRATGASTDCAGTICSSSFSLHSAHNPATRATTSTAKATACSDSVRDALERRFRCPIQARGPLVVHLLGNEVAGLAFHKSGHHPLMMAADDRINKR